MPWVTKARQVKNTKPTFWFSAGVEGLGHLQRLGIPPLESSGGGLAQRAHVGFCDPTATWGSAVPMVAGWGPESICCIVSITTVRKTNGRFRSFAPYSIFRYPSSQPCHQNTGECEEPRNQVKGFGFKSYPRTVQHSN